MKLDKLRWDIGNDWKLKIWLPSRDGMKLDLFLFFLCGGHLRNIVFFYSKRLTEIFDRIGISRFD